MTAWCSTTMHYLKAVGAQGLTDQPVEVVVHDGRAADLPGWTECGFELVQQRSAVNDWSDDDQIVSVHYEELEQLARKLTGADVALVASHIRRSPDSARRNEQLSPITFVHSDFAAGHEGFVARTYSDPSASAGAALARNGVEPDAVSGARRIMVLQFWRNLGATEMEFPIAFCDARTVSPSEERAFHVTNYAGTGASFDALGILEPVSPSAHRWYAFPRLTVDEVVAFRTYDTHLVRANRTYFTPHSAFRHPGVEGKPARDSIELRASCMWL